MLAARSMMRIYLKVNVKDVVLKSNPSRAKRERDFVLIVVDGIGGIVIIERLTKKPLPCTNASVVAKNSHPMAITKESIVVTNVTSKTS